MLSSLSNLLPTDGMKYSINYTVVLFLAQKIGIILGKNDPELVFEKNIFFKATLPELWWKLLFKIMNEIIN